MSKRKLPLIAAASTRLHLRAISTHLADATDAAALRALLPAPRAAQRAAPRPEIGDEIEMQSAGASPDDLGVSPDDHGGEDGLADCVVTSYLPYISPISPLYLHISPYISRTAW